MTLRDVTSALFDFAFYYPLFMSYLWMITALYYYFYREFILKRTRARRWDFGRVQ